MIVAFSTSSPQSSVALFDGGRLVWSAREMAPQRASGACLKMLQTGLQETGLTLEEADLWVADLGPGSFTGVRVGIVLAKTFAWSLGAKCAGIDAFDLISNSQIAVLPSRKNEYFVRVPGQEPVKGAEIPADAVGYGFHAIDTYPDAARAESQLDLIVAVNPEVFVPGYRIEPSISIPKKPYIGVNP